MTDQASMVTTIERDILSDRRVLGICLVNGKRCIVPLERYMQDYKSIAYDTQRILNSAFDYLYVDLENQNPFGMLG